MITRALRPLAYLAPVALAFGAAGCGAAGDAAAEQLAERAVERAAGADVDVDLDGDGNLTVQTDDGRQRSGPSCPRGGPTTSPCPTASGSSTEVR